MTGIPKTQKAIVYEKQNASLEYKDVPVPKPKANEILVNIKYSGVCHSDLHAWKGDWPLDTKLPLIGGHEGVGVVVAKGDNVNNFEVGDLAGVKWLFSSCMSCEYCEESKEPNCPEAQICGITVDGTFQQYCAADAAQAVNIPEGTDLAEAAPILCAGVTVYKALKTAQLKAGDWVAISGGGGGLGSLGIQYARAMGYRVLAIDSGDEKKKLCEKELKAEVFIDFTKTKDIVADIQKITNGGPHGVINVSVSEQAIAQSCEFVRPTGTVVLVGLPSGSKVATDVFGAVVRCINIRASYVGNRADSRESLDFYIRGLVKSPIKIAGLSELPDIYKKMDEGKIVGRYVVDTSK